MEIPLESNRAGAVSPAAREKFGICVLYDTPAAQHSAVRISDFVANQLGVEIPAETTFWNMRFFGASAIQNEAAGAAAFADLIVVVCSEVSSVTFELRGWAEKWAGKREIAGGGLAAVLPNCGPENAELLEFFRTTAQKAGMDFICRTGNAEKDQQFYHLL